VGRLGVLERRLRGHRAPGPTRPSQEIYPAQGQYQGARPAFSAYSGESINYNSRVSAVKSYQMIDDTITDAASDYGSVTYLDGQTHDYVPTKRS